MQNPFRISSFRAHAEYIHNRCGTLSKISWPAELIQKFCSVGTGVSTLAQLRELRWPAIGAPEGPNRPNKPNRELRAPTAYSKGPQSGEATF